MDRTRFVLGVAFVSALLSAPATESVAQPNKGKEIYVIVKAQLYEVDEAFYKKLVKAGRLSKEDLREAARPS